MQGQILAQMKNLDRQLDWLELGYHFEILVVLDFLGMLRQGG